MTVAVFDSPLPGCYDGAQTPRPYQERGNR